MDKFYGAAKDAGWITQMPKDHPEYGKHGINTSLAAKKDAATGEWTDAVVVFSLRFFLFTLS